MSADYGYEIEIQVRVRTKTRNVQHVRVRVCILTRIMQNVRVLDMKSWECSFPCPFADTLLSYMSLPSYEKLRMSVSVKNVRVELPS